MNERLFRPQFNQMETTEKQALMENLAVRYTMTFLGLQPFDRWGQSCTTGVFEKDGREFVFVPGDTVTLGWDHFAVGLNPDSRWELDYLFQEWEMEPRDPEEMIQESMASVRQASIGPMLVGRKLEELCWEPVKMNDPRVTAHPDWLKKFREFAWSDLDSLTLHKSTRIERTEKGFQIWIYNRTDYDELLDGLEMLGTKLQGKYGHLGFKYKKSDKTLTRHSKNYTYMIAFSSFGGNTKDSISIEVCYIINTRPYDPYGYAKPDINTQPLFYSLRDNEIYLDIGNEEKIDNVFEVVCQWMDKILIPKMNELCATE